jgi:hypothetical protein
VEQSYEVVGRRPGARWQALALPVLVAVGVLAGGLLGNVRPNRAPAPVAPVPLAVAMPVAPSVEAVAGPPRVVDCGEMLAYLCQGAVLAAREAIGGTDVSIDSARAWPPSCAATSSTVHGLCSPARNRSAA